MEHSLSFDAAHSTFLGLGRAASQVALAVKNLPANARDIRDTGSIPGSGSSPGEANGKPLQYSCLENPMDRGLQATVHRVNKELDTTKAIWHARTLLFKK